MHNFNNSYNKLYHVIVKYCNIFSFTLSLINRNQLEAVAFKHTLAKKIYVQIYIFV